MCSISLCRESKMQDQGNDCYSIWELSWGKTVLSGNRPGDNCPGGKYLGDNYPGWIVLSPLWPVYENNYFTALWSTMLITLLKFCSMSDKLGLLNWSWQYLCEGLSSFFSERNLLLICMVLHFMWMRDFLLQGTYL